MSWFDGMRQRLRETFRRSAVDAELDEELRHHVAEETERQLGAGLEASEAKRRAAIRAGSVELARENVRVQRTGKLWREAAGDVRYGLRGLRRSPGFATAVVLSLALGTGGTTAIFSVVYGVLMRPLAYPDSDRLYEVRVYWGDFGSTMSYADVLGSREVSTPGVAGVSGYFYPDDGFTWQTPDGPEVLAGAFLLEDLPSVLGISPLLGPGFSEERGVPEVLIGERLWRERFGGARDVVGRTMDLDGESATIVGVMPAGFDVPGQRDGALWARSELSEPTRRGAFYIFGVARLSENAEAEAAARELTAAVTPILRERFGVDEEWRYQLRPWKEALTGDVRPTLILLSVAVGLVLLIAVMNVANLLLARGTVRVRELAVRASLGAGRFRLARQLLAESALLGLLGGVTGLLLAIGALEVASTHAQSVVPRMEDVGLNAAVVLFALSSGLVAGLGAGVMPAWRVDWERLSSSLREGGRGSSESGRQRRLRRALVASEVALSLTVLTGAGLLVKSLNRLERQHPGFEAADVLSFRLVLNGIEEDEPERMGAFLEQLKARLRAIPSVSNVAFAAALPPNRLQYSNNYTLESDAVERRQSGVAEWVVVDPEYFSALGIPVLNGRPFQDGDRQDAPAVAVVNEAFARHHFPEGNALGKRFKGGDWDSDGEWMTIAGVVADVPYAAGVWSGAALTVYTPYARNLWQSSPYVLLKSDRDAAGLVTAARTAVRDIDPRLPLRDVATMEQRLRDSAAAPRFRGLLFSLLALLALALALTGIYGVMAYHVSQRRRETAIRRALGAQSSSVLTSVVLSGLTLTLMGVAVGVLGAFAMARSLTTLLFQVDPIDLRVLAGSAALLAASAILACALPAARAARVDPLSILRED
jgi:putative ABC transport system permease protein